MANTLKDKLDAIEAVERELIKRAQPIVQAGDGISFTSMFLLGATQRTLSQSLGFRQLIESRNGPCAIILLRTQIDTAMRINGLSLMGGEVERNLHRFFKEEVKFDQLLTGADDNGSKAERLTDAYLRKQIAANHPWINDIYTNASDFVHLSFRHLKSAVYRTEDKTGIVYFAITGTDPQGDESKYYEICDAFLHVSNLTSGMILGALTAIHRPEDITEQTGKEGPQDDRE